MDYLADHYRKQAEILEKRRDELKEELKTLTTPLTEANIKSAGEIHKELQANREVLTTGDRERLSRKAQERSDKTKRLLFALSDEKSELHHPSNAHIKDSVIKVLADTMSAEYEKALEGYADTTDIKNAVKVLKQDPKKLHPGSL